MFARIAVVNRGESAMRLIHAVRDLNAAAPDAERIEVIALHTEGEKTAMFVREADVAYDLGPAAERPYLNYAVLERALKQTRADAAWVGWGFVAEDPGFAELCERIGVTFIGPSPEAMRKLGDKIGSKLIAEQVGVPVAAWSRGGVDTLADAIAAADRIGYPLMLKATAGGGGRGIRRVNCADDLTDAYERTRDEAQRAFGSGVVFLEKLVTGARHVEVQVIADGQGTAWAIGVRDCSVQRRNQKVIEESSSVVMAPEQAQLLKDSAERLAVAVGYSGAGTVEFLFQPTDGTFAFLEVNTRLQVEHPITEVTTDTDLVKLQIQVASGERLTGERPVERGHAVEARLNAEDADRDFAPAPGRIAFLDFPSGPGIRVDTGVAEGDSIPADFDSMIAKIIAYGRDRDEALARLRRAMTETTVVIEGGATNKSFVLDLLSQPEVIAGTADTGWIDRVRGEGRLLGAPHTAVALIAAGIDAYEDLEAIERARLLETARGGRPQVQHKVGAPVELTLRGVPYRVTVLRTGPVDFRATVESATQRVTADASLTRLGEHNSRLQIGGRTFRVVTATHGPIHMVEVDGSAHRVSRDEGGVIRSQAPALVVATPVAVGTEVAAGQPVLVLESMKMETVIPAPFAARVKELLVRAGTQVETGAPLARLEQLSDAGDSIAEPAAEVPLELPTEGRTGRATRGLSLLEGLVLGYDIDAPTSEQALADYVRSRGASRGLDDELRLLDMGADFAELGRNRPADEEDDDHAIHSPREYFHTYLKSLDPDREGLPDQFRQRMQRVLAHYGVTSLDCTPELEAAVFRVFLAQQNQAESARLAMMLLQQWLKKPAPTGEQSERVRGVLDRLIVATQARFPAVGELARTVRFGWFDQPGVDAERTRVLAEVASEVSAIAALPEGLERSARIDALTEIPERISSVLAQRMVGGVPGSEPTLPLLILRHYREHELSNQTEFTVDGYPFATADYTLDDQPRRLVTSVGELADLVVGGAWTTALTHAIDQVSVPVTGEPRDLIVELYAHAPGLSTEPAATGESLIEQLGPLGFTTTLRRLTLGIVRDAQSDVQYVTLRPGTGEAAGTLVEDLPVRGLHPMVGRRLNLWRLRDFDVTRLDAPTDVVLLHCVAKQNPADQRLVALAQVRQFTVDRDRDGKTVGLPNVERALATCLDAIRRARASMPQVRLDMNHVWLHVWPIVEADMDQLTALQDKISPMAAGAGIEDLRFQGRIRDPERGVRMIVARFTYAPGSGVGFDVHSPSQDRLAPLDAYSEKVQRARRRGLVYPYELHQLVEGDGGTLVEYDLDAAETQSAGRLVPVERPYGQNKAGIICAVVSTPTTLHPQGVERVLLCGDPLRSLGSIAQAECRRIMAALDLAEERGIPVEWWALSAGARIAMDSGTENMDWIAAALKRIVDFTQAGHEINVVVAGINVGAQPYWNAEATMLMHTKGILVMTPDSAMVLTGKQSLDFSGGVSAEDNFGIGGYDRVMGPNGQAQYWAKDFAGAIDVLMEHYDASYVAAGENGPRRAETNDPSDRDVTTFPHVMAGSDFTTVGDIWSANTNPDRKKAFDIRTVLRAVSDQDHPMRERWAGMADAETAVVTDARLGGHSVTLIGIESKSVPRRGFPPTDGPDTYTAGTLFPRSSKKVARAINAASGNRPVVVLANLSGFDGSPDSMRNLQLEYGAEIGRAVVNFDGPIVFAVISRYHGGAFVVFSKALNAQMTVLAIEGSYASVIGGAPAAAVVFSRDVDARTAADPRVKELEASVEAASRARRPLLVAELAELRGQVRAEMVSSVAAEFDGVHNIHRAVEVGSVDEVIAPEALRPRIIRALDEAE